MLERKGWSRRFTLMMTHPSLTNIISAVLGISGFLVSLSAGMFSGNSIDSVLERALVCTFLCFLAGGGIGMLLDGVLERHAQKLRIESASDDELGHNEASEASEESAVTPSEPASSPQAIA